PVRCLIPLTTSTAIRFPAIVRVAPGASPAAFFHVAEECLATASMAACSCLLNLLMRPLPAELGTRERHRARRMRILSLDYGLRLPCTGGPINDRSARARPVSSPARGTARTRSAAARTSTLCLRHRRDAAA